MPWTLFMVSLSLQRKLVNYKRLSEGTMQGLASSKPPGLVSITQEEGEGGAQKPAWYRAGNCLKKNNPFEVRLMLVKHCCGLRVKSVTCNYEGDILTLKAIANPFIQDSLN